MVKRPLSPGPYNLSACLLVFVTSTLWVFTVYSKFQNVNDANLVSSGTSWKKWKMSLQFAILPANLELGQVFV